MTPEENLARLRDGQRWRPHKGDRPWLRRVDDNGTGLTIECPGPRVLADIAAPALRHEFFRQGSTVLARAHGSNIVPAPVSLAQVAEEIRAWIGALRARQDAGRPYADLRRMVETARPETIADYLSEVARYVRMAAPRWSPPPSAEPRPPAMTPAERKRAQRIRHRVEEAESASWWLRLWVEQCPGERVARPTLYERASSAIAEFVEEAEDDLDAWAMDTEEDGSPSRPRTPGPRTFYAAANRLVGRPVTARGTRYYVAQEAPVTPMTEAILDRAARIVVEEAREEILTFAQGDARQSGTGTDGRVIALDARRMRPS